MAVLLAFNCSAGFSASTTASGITIGAVTERSTSLTSFENFGIGYSSDNIGVAGPTSGATDAASAITAGSYFFTTINPLSGKQMSLTTLTIDMARGGAATPRGYDIRSSVDSYAATLGTGTLTAQRPTFQNISIDISGASFQNVAAPITFRFYVFSPNPVNTIDWDNLTINGSVADSGTVEQEGFRFRADDGSETTATWLALQDTDIIRAKSTNTRLRIVLNSTLDRGAESYRLEFRKVGDSTWIPLGT